MDAPPPADVVRAFFEAAAKRDEAAMRALLDPAVEWHNTRELPGGEVRHGPEAVEETLRDQASAVDDFRVDADEMRVVGEQVLVHARLRGRMKGSSAELDAAVGQVWTVRDGKVVRFRPFFDRSEAEAVAEREASG